MNETPIILNIILSSLVIVSLLPPNAPVTPNTVIIIAINISILPINSKIDIIESPNKLSLTHYQTKKITPTLPQKEYTHKPL